MFMISASSVLTALSAMICTLLTVCDGMHRIRSDRIYGLSSLPFLPLFSFSRRPYEPTD
jgi:hypothetical protein